MSVDEIEFEEQVDDGKEFEEFLVLSAPGQWPEKV